MRRLLVPGALLGVSFVLAGMMLKPGLRPATQAEPIRRLPADRNAAVRYVALGDSTVEGIGASSPELHYVGRLHSRLRSIYPRAELVNLGAGGATAADVRWGQLRAAVARRPHLVTLSVGPNDVTQGRGPEQYERDVAAIFERLTAETGAVVVVNLLPDLSLAPRFEADERLAVAQVTLAFNEALERQAQRYAVQVVDLYGASRAEVPDHAELVSADEYHPSDAGYARWAEYMWLGVAAHLES